ncbi:dihydrofolate reductase [Rhodobacter phage RcSimone-Hastad]|nr:dihydrofolate reductase [Rhodobacter phage RcSimone-Hastad]
MSTLKLVMAVSKDGFVSLGPDDDMLWTGPDDKRAFRLLTSVGGVLGAGRKTFEQLPRLKGRRVYCISTRRGYIQNAEAREAMQAPFLDGPVSDEAAYEQTLSLGQFAHQHPNGWLIGGQTVALDALGIGLVDQVFLCHAPIELHRSTLFDPRVAQRDLISHRISSWSRQERLKIGGTTVEVWRRK